MNLSNPALELHERVLADLDRRGAAVVEQEAEARRVLEQALARCAAARTNIDQDRAVLEQAGKLYRQFIETNPGSVPEANAAPPAPVPEGRSVLSDLRRQLWHEYEGQSDDVSAQRTSWKALAPVEGASSPLQ